jgi:hypothetical protein
MTKLEALKLVSEGLQQKSPPNDPWIVLEADTIERPFGWVFFYNTKRFIETGVFKYRLAGNGPVIVDRESGAVRFYGSIPPVDEIIEGYEREWVKSHSG